LIPASDTKSMMEAGSMFTCAACHEPMAESLSRLGSLRCHDCRDIEAPTQLQDRPDDRVPRELDYRAGAGLEVSLLWYDSSKRITVRVLDSRTGDRFEFRVRSEDAAAAFRHPFAYAPKAGRSDIALPDSRAYAEAA
jgi:hypothetical protein